jgi:hypothetical protein
MLKLNLGVCIACYARFAAAAKTIAGGPNAPAPWEKSRELALQLAK